MEEARERNAEAARIMKRNHDRYQKGTVKFELHDKVMITPVGKGTRNYGPYEISGLGGHGTSAYVYPCHPDYGTKSLRSKGKRDPEEFPIPMERLIKLKPGEMLKVPHYPRKRMIVEELQL
jgi:hypothetical protein